MTPLAAADAFPGPAPAPASARAPTAEDALALQATVLAHAAFPAAAFAFASELATRLDFDRVSLGVVDRGAHRVVAISDGTPAGDAGPGAMHLAAAMDEVLDHGATIAVPGPHELLPPARLAHAALARRYGGVVITVPLVVGGTVVGAATLERRAAEAAQPDEVANAEHLVCVLASVLWLRWRESRPLATRIGEAVSGWFADLGSPAGARRRLLFAGAACALAAGTLIPVDYHVGGRARVEGAVQRQLAAPVDGFLQAAHVRPGDRVREGQVLAELADRDLLLERRRVDSELAQHEVAFAGAMARADRAQAAIDHARAAEAQARLGLVDARLARVRIRAPFDGVVVGGDLAQAVGAPVQLGAALITVAAAGGFRVIVEVDERDVAGIAPGMRGELTLTALPWDALPFEVERITPIADPVDGANVFEVEASLREAPADLRPGLRGMARVRVGERALLVGWTRRAVDWLRLVAWDWTG